MSFDLVSVKSRIEEVGELYFPSPPFPFPFLPSLPLTLEVGPLKSS